MSLSPRRIEQSKSQVIRPVRFKGPAPGWVEQWVYRGTGGTADSHLEELPPSFFVLLIFHVNSGETVPHPFRGDKERTAE